MYFYNDCVCISFCGENMEIYILCSRFATINGHLDMGECLGRGERLDRDECLESGERLDTSELLDRD